MHLDTEANKWRDKKWSKMEDWSSHLTYNGVHKPESRSFLIKSQRETGIDESIENNFVFF